MIALALLVGCAGGGACDTTEGPDIVIGVGETAYEEHVDGDPVTLIHGPQGGVHITLAFETIGFDIREELVGELEGTIDGTLMATANPFVFLRCNNQTGTQQVWDQRLIYDADPADIDGALTEVTVTLTDGSGDSASATTTFVIDDPTL